MPVPLAPSARPVIDYFCGEIVYEIDEICEYIWDIYCDQHAARFCEGGAGARRGI